MSQSEQFKAAIDAAYLDVLKKCRAEVIRYIVERKMNSRNFEIKVLDSVFQSHIEKLEEGEALEDMTQDDVVSLIAEFTKPSKFERAARVDESEQSWE